MNPEHPNPPRRGIRRGIYIVPSAFTIGNIFCGFYAVMSAAKGYQQLSSPELAAPFFDNAARAIGIEAAVEEPPRIERGHAASLSAGPPM